MLSAVKHLGTHCARSLASLRSVLAFIHKEWYDTDKSVSFSMRSIQTSLYRVKGKQIEKSMTGSTRSARQQILDTAADLFFREGYRAVGIDTIIERSGVAKMTLYRHFASKDELIAAYLVQTNEQFWAWFEEATGKHPDSPRAQLVAVFQALATLVTKSTCYGCPFLHAATEFPALDHPGHRVALEHKQAVRTRLRYLAAQADARHPEVLADQLLLLMDGAFIQARMFGPANPASHVAQAAITLIEAHLPG